MVAAWIVFSFVAAGNAYGFTGDTLVVEGYTVVASVSVLLFAALYVRGKLYRWQVIHWQDSTTFAAGQRSKIGELVAARVAVPTRWYRVVAALFESADVDTFAEGHPLARRLLMLFRGSLVTVLVVLELLVELSVLSVMDVFMILAVFGRLVYSAGFRARHGWVGVWEGAASPTAVVGGDPASLQATEYTPLLPTGPAREGSQEGIGCNLSAPARVFALLVDLPASWLCWAIWIPVRMLCLAKVAQLCLSSSYASCLPCSLPSSSWFWWPCCRVPQG